MAIDPRVILYSKEMSPFEFNFETLHAPSMYQWLSLDDIYQLNKIVNSVKLSSNIQEKKRRIDQIMRSRGCHKIGGGTNRVVYAPYECTVNCFKIALDTVGIKANRSEYVNQNHLKPFIVKMFEIDPSGVIGNYERIKAIQSREEYISVAEDIYELLSNNIIGKYVMEDIGTNYMFNYGVRPGFGAVLLDYAMLFELDGSKLYCNNSCNGVECGGEIDYDTGFNHLYCTKCGLHYQARKLAASIKEKRIKVMKEENDMSLISQLIIDGEVVLESEGSTETINEPLGTIITRKVRMTPKEIKKYEQEQRRKNKQQKKHQEVIDNEETSTIAIVEDNTQQTIGDIVNEALNDIIKQDDIKPQEDKVEEPVVEESTIEEYQDDDVESVSNFDVEALQESILNSDDYDEPDYSKYGLDEDDSEEEQQEEHSNDSYKEDDKVSMKNFTKTKKKKNKLENL